MKESECLGVKEMIIRPVGFVKNDIINPSLKAKGKDIEIDKGIKKAAKEAKRIHSIISDLVINPELDGILDGLEDFSHALVLYWPNLLSHQGRSLIKVHPMGQKHFPLVGVFSTCSPARPNPVLVTTVRVLERKGNILRVQGLEAVNGSPIIDIKPYTPSYYLAEDVKVSPWMEKIQRVTVLGTG